MLKLSKSKAISVIGILGAALTAVSSIYDAVQAGKNRNGKEEPNGTNESEKE